MTPLHDMPVQELMVRLFDKDSSSDDFLGEATLVLCKLMSHAYVVKQLHVLVVMPHASGDLLAAPKLTQTLPLVIPGSHHAHVCVWTFPACARMGFQRLPMISLCHELY